MSAEKWFRVDEVPAPLAIAVKTKIDDENGVRHVRPLQRLNDGRLWWTIDGDMYVYYTPTHWRFYAQGEAVK